MDPEVIEHLTIGLTAATPSEPIATQIAVLAIGMDCSDDISDAAVRMPR